MLVNPRKEPGGSASRPPWFALRVNSRREKAITTLLEEQGYECFLPAYKCRRRWSDRIKEIDTPLFPGYLFSRFDPRESLPILKTPGVASIIGTRKKPVPVNEQEIAAVRTVLQAGLPAQPWPFLREGDRVRIESGAFRGLEGILLEFRGHFRIIISISLLQRSVAAEIDSAWVSKVRSRSPGFPVVTGLNIDLSPAAS